MRLMYEQSALYGMPARTIADRCRVDVATARRWKRGETAIPYTAQAIIAGDLGALDSAWRGWRVHGGRLVSPEGLESSPGDVRAIPFMDSLRESLRARIRELEQQKGPPACDEQPRPEDWADTVPRLRLVAV